MRRWPLSIRDTILIIIGVFVLSLARIHLDDKEEIEAMVDYRLYDVEKRLEEMERMLGR
ncbi:MAG: hypothetical protein KDA17_05810 [Candidatus Saccharibacteria bacterium]|nr:hypothetical protein [Candidatus Saccharibacteria bacterium]